MYKKKYKPSKKKIASFLSTLKEIELFCSENGIVASASFDSYYFTINGVNYRVSNHTIKQSNRKAFNEYGVQVRELYHSEDELKNTVCITASKTRIIEIYSKLKEGKILNARGYLA